MQFILPDQQMVSQGEHSELEFEDIHNRITEPRTTWKLINGDTQEDDGG